MKKGKTKLTPRLALTVSVAVLLVMATVGLVALPWLDRYAGQLERLPSDVFERPAGAVGFMKSTALQALRSESLSPGDGDPSSVVRLALIWGTGLLIIINSNNIQ